MGVVCQFALSEYAWVGKRLGNKCSIGPVVDKLALQKTGAARKGRFPIYS